MNERQSQNTREVRSIQSGLTQTKRSRGSRCQSDHVSWHGSSRVEIDQTSLLETAPLEALKAILSIAALHRDEFSIMHKNVSRACFHAKSTETSACEVAS